MRGFDRRGFLRVAGAASAGTLTSSLIAPRLHALAVAGAEPEKPIAANDHIQMALMGPAARAKVTRAWPCRCRA